TLDRIAITHPAVEHVPITMGVSGPMLLRLAGELADGVLLAAGAGADYIRFAREQVGEGCARAGRADGSVAFSTVAMTCVDEDGDRARAALRPMFSGFLAEFGVNTMTDAYGISDQLTDMIERGGADVVEAEMPDAWMDDLTL